MTREPAASYAPMNAFTVGDRPMSENERDARHLIRVRASGNEVLAGLLHDLQVDRVIVREPRPSLVDRA